MFDSPLCTALQLKILDGRLANSFKAAEECDADRPVGYRDHLKKTVEYVKYSHRRLRLYRNH